MNTEGNNSLSQTWHLSNRSSDAHFLASVNISVILDALIIDGHESQVLLQFPKTVQTIVFSVASSSLLGENKAFHGWMGDINSPQSASGAPSGAPPQEDEREPSWPNAQTSSAGSSWQGVEVRVRVRYVCSSTWILPPRRKLISATCAGHLILLATTPVSSEAAMFCSILPSLAFLWVASEMQSWSWCS